MNNFCISTPALLIALFCSLTSVSAHDENRNLRNRGDRGSRDRGNLTPAPPAQLPTLVPVFSAPVAPTPIHPPELPLSQVLPATDLSCGGNCPQGGCTNCWCGSTPAPVSASAWCAQHNWNQENCLCIINAESSSNANAVHNGGGGGGYDVGLFQINEFHWGGTGSAPCDPQANLEYAKQVYSEANTWFRWSTCQTCGCCDQP